MIKIVFILALFIGACSSDKYSIEDEIYICMVAKFDARNIDLDYYLNAIETNLVDQQILKDKSGTSKIEFFKEFAQKEGRMNIDYTAAMDSILQFINLHNLTYELTCLGEGGILVKGDSSDYVYFKKVKQLQKVNSSLIKNGQFTVVQIAEGISKVYTAEDYNHPLYRARMLLLTSILAQSHQSYLTAQDEKSKEVIDLNDEIHDPALKIYLGVELDSARIGDKLFNNVEDFDKIIADYLRNANYSHFIIKPFSKTPYQKYVVITQLVDKSYKVFINEMALEKFNKSYTELSDNEQNEINKEYPLKVIESDL